MPNWCMNFLTVSHSDPAQIERFVKAAVDGRLFAEFVPLSDDGEWDYGAAVSKWGTKWDIHESHFDSNGNSAHGSFDTAWAPPIAFYEALTEMGFEIDALYREEGMAFAGVFQDGVEKYYKCDFSDPNWRDAIDNDDILFILEEEYENWLEWQEEMAEEE